MRLPFRYSDSVSYVSLELVHFDVWGYFLTSSLGGATFYVTFIDDFRKYCWLFPLHLKSQVFDVFLNFKSLVENMFDRKIKSLQTDGGGEFTSTRFKNVLVQNGISDRI